MHDWFCEIGYLAILRPDAHSTVCQSKSLASCYFGEVVRLDHSQQARGSVKPKSINPWNQAGQAELLNMNRELFLCNPIISVPRTQELKFGRGGKRSHSELMDYGMLMW